MGIKKIIVGEPMPDENDTKYKERAERDRKAGGQFAHAIGLDRLAACIQRFATNRTKLFLFIVFSFVLFSIGLNLYRMSKAVTYRPQPSSAIQRQEHELKFKRHHAPKSVNQQSRKQLELEEYEAYRED